MDSERRTDYTVELQSTKAVDWALMKHEFITTNISLHNLSLKYNVKYITLKAKYYNENWAQQAKEYAAEIDQHITQIRKNRASDIAEKIALIDDRVIGLSEGILDQIDEVLNKNNASIESSDASLKDSIATIKAATQAIKEAYLTIRLAGGKSTAMVEFQNSLDIPDEETQRIEDELNYLSAKVINIQAEVQKEQDVDKESGQD
jgi:hypothetical protein